MQIDKNIPIPGRANNKGKRKYPFAEMQIGDSILIVHIPMTSVTPQVTRAERETGFKFTARKVSGGVRVWRVY